MNDELKEKLIYFAPIPSIVVDNIDRFLSIHFDSSLAERLIEENIPFFSKLFGYSQYLRDIALAHPGFVDYSFKHLDSPFDKINFLEEVLSYSEFFQESRKSKFLKLLNELKQREFLKIAIREMLGISSFGEAVREFSDLADAVVHLVVKINYDDFVINYGVPSSQFCVVGLGKLGGRELNYSSDIDVIFVYEKDGETAKGIQNSEFFDKLAKSVVYDLTSRMNGSFLFRVDTRLRPDGEFGPLVRSEESYYRYYTERADTWEIQALVKARFVGGDEELGKRFENNIKDIVYSTPVSESDIAQILSIKEKIKGDEYNVKKCSGGIRDIEFIVQALQLVFGFKEESVRVQNTLEAINSLFAKGMINSDIEIKLKTSYILLRRIENYIQLYNNLQDFSLPVKDGNRMVGIYRLLYFLEGLPSGDEQQKLLEVFKRAKENVLEVKRIIFQNFLEISGGEEVVLFLYNSNEEEVRNLLSSYGLDPDTSFNFVSDIVSRSTKGGVETSLGLKNLLRTVSRTKNPNLALSNIYSILEVTGNLPIAIQIFLEKNNVEFMSNIALLKEVFINILRRRHWIWDGTMDPEAFVDYLRGNLFVKLKDSSSGVANLEEFLRYVRDVCEVVLLSMALFRTNGLLSTYEVRRLFTEFYNVVFEGVCRFVGNGFGIIRLGRWAAGELTFFSDLDTIYFIDYDVYSDDWYKIKSEVEKIHNKLNDIFSIDVRLVEGAHKGSPFISETTLRSAKLEFWQLVAYLKSNCLSIDGDLEERVNSLLVDSLNRSVSSDLQQRFYELRTKAIKFGGENFDIKKGEGGLLDLELALVKKFYQTFKEVRREHLGLGLKGMVEILRDSVGESELVSRYIEILFSVEDVLKVLEKEDVNDRVLRYYAGISYDEFGELRSKVLEWLRSEWS
jgi:glutamate-ammonia-ligase adenylyltransferase